MSLYHAHLLSVVLAAGAPAVHLTLSPIWTADPADQAVARRLTADLARAEPARLETLPALAPHGPDERLGEELERARKSIDALQFTRAAAVLHGAIADAWARPWVDLDRVASAELLLSVAAFRARHRPDADAALTEVFRLRPAFDLEREGHFPAAFVAEANAARQRALRLPRVALQLRGPPELILRIDGRWVGALPVQATVSEGRHALTLESKAGELWSTPVLARGKRQPVNLVDFASVPARLAATPLHGPTVEAAALARLQAMARLADAQWVLVGALRQGGGQEELWAALVDAASGRLWSLPPVRFVATPDQVRAAAQAVARGVLLAVAHPTAAEVPYLLGAPAPSALPQTVELKPNAAPAAPPAALTPPAVAQEPGPSRTGWPWWVWAAGGAVAAGVGGYLLASNLHTSSGASVRATW